MYKKVKVVPHSYEHRFLELILILGSQPVGERNDKPSGRLPLLSARPVVTSQLPSFTAIG